VTADSSPRGPGKPRALTAEREAMAATLRRAGYGVAPIAELFGISPRTMHAVFRREGVAATRGRRRLTVAQEEEVRALRRQGWTLIAIGQHFGISRDAVRTVTRTEQP
jgi:lambda repressor-like predicted transcriptional regulator